MERDVTMQLIEAQEARSRMQEAKKRIKAEVKRKYESAINLEIAERSQDAEIEFARTLARVHASGVSQALLRREVLRTNVWSVWTYWRDLAGIDPERVSIASAKAVKQVADARANLTFEWRDKVLYVLKNPVTGTPLPHELALPFYFKKGTNARFDTGPSTYNRYLVTTDFDEDYMSQIPELSDKDSVFAYWKALIAEITRAYADGDVTENTSPDTYVNNVDNPNYMEEMAVEYEKLYEMNPWVTKGAGQ